MGRLGKCREQYSWLFQIHQDSQNAVAFDGMRHLDLVWETDWGGVCQKQVSP